jgi:hypothetical protein
MKLQSAVTKPAKYFNPKVSQPTLRIVSYGSSKNCQSKQIEKGTRKIYITFNLEYKVL